MGNNTSSNTVSRQRTGVDDLASKQGSRSWATMDHTISGPWSFIVKEHVQCMCEGGKSCSGENPARQPTPNAVVGLHSNWVGDNILAMARPWQENILKHDLVNKFIELDVGMILNLQEVGEHDSCGPGNLPNSGFTYSPETFMAARIGFYNLSWRDMGVPTLDKMMDIVQIMHYTTAVEKKKIVVHCHAGLGRTGLAIACYKVACEQMTATQAIDFVRQCRPGSLQTKAQVLFVPIFEQYTQHLRCLFKVADLRQLSLGNENYILTKVSHKLSRSVSARSRSASDSVAAATAALNSISIAGNCGTSVDSHGEVLTAATAADWTAATFEPMTADEAAKVPSAAEAAATAALNLSGNGSEDGILVQHARRLSAGGGSMKLVCNLKAITEDADKPVHVLETDSAVTEVYNSGLTIIRSAQSAKKLQALAPRATTEQLVLERMLTTTDLGLDCQKPWNEKFHVKPEAYVAEGWLPEAPSSYVEALRRQQRLLHGMERRQSLRLHKLPKAAAKALFNAGRAYNEVMEHLDIPPAIGASSSTSGILKRTHSRSRSSAAAELLALTAGLSSSSNGGGSLPMSLSKGHLGSLSASSTSSGHCASPGSSSLGGAAQSLLPAGINFGAPGCSRGNSTSGHQRGNKSCLAGCCAPSFAAGLLAALLYKGRYPEEYKVQWSLCPRLTALGFAEGPIICSQLQSIKLALNAGKYEMLETASAAVAIVVLGDWFESFVSEALTEKTLELMVDEADQLLAETLEVIEIRRSLLQRLTDSAANPRQHPQHRSKTTLGVVTEQEDSEALAHKATARAVCCEMLAHEQELCLLLAAMMRRVRLASIEDSRLQSWMNSSEFEKAMESGSRANKPQLSSQSLHLSALSAQQQAIEEEVDAAMDALYKICASWLLGPLAVACSTALEAVQKFLNFLTLDDDAYSYLLQATREQGIKKSHSQPSQNSIDSLDSLYSSSTAPTTPRSRLRDRLANITSHKSAGHGSPRSGSCPGTLNSTARGTTSRSKLGETASSPPQKHSSQPSMKIGAFSPKGSHLGPGLMQNSTRSLEGLRMSPSASRLPQPEQQGTDRSNMQWPGFSEVEDYALVPGHGIQLAQEESCSPGGERQPERVDTVNTACPGLSSLAAELGDKGSQPDLGVSGVPIGLLPIPPRSASPVPPSGSRSSTGARQIQLPAMRASGASAALAAGVGLQGNIASTAADAAGGQQSAHTKLTAQQQQQPSPANDNCINSSTLPAAAAAAAASVPASAGVSTVPSSVDVGANQMLSASMLSDIQLPSFASTCSVAESLLAQSRQSVDISSLRG